MQNKQLEIKRVQQSQQNTAKVIKKKKKKRKQFLWPIRIGSVALIGLLIYFSIELINFNILPIFFLIPILLILTCVSLLFIIFGNVKARRPITRLISLIVIVSLAVGCGIGSNFITKTKNMFDSVTNLTDKMINKITVVVMNDSNVQKIQDLEGKNVAVTTTIDNDSVNRSLSDLEKNGVHVNTVDYATFDEQIGALYDNAVDAVIVNDAHRGIIREIEHLRYTFFNTETRPIHETVFYTDREHIMETSKDGVNVTREPFTVFVSGNDSYGSLNEVSRSDVNMLVTVNPKTHKVLLTSVPRDLYLPVKCAEGVEGCPADMNDKLTHTGLSGIATTEQTIEAALGIDINYNVRVNFSSVVNLIDALGGIDVEVEPGLEVERFAGNNLEGVKSGTNHLDGERALGFMRERYAYADGDAQRVRNQQQVIMRMVQKIASPSMLVNFGKFMDALSGSFETNMSSDDMLALARYEFTFFPEWEFENYAIFAYEDNQYCPYLGGNAFVFTPEQQSLDIARNKVQAIINGESASSVSEEIV